MYLFIFRCTYLYIIFVLCEILSAGNKSDLCWAPHHNIFYLNLWWPADQNIGPVQSQSSSADLCRKTPPTAAIRRNGELSRTHHHHGHSAVIVNTARLCRNILNSLFTYTMFVRCLSCIISQLRAAARWRCTSSCWRVTTRPWGEQHHDTLGTSASKSSIRRFVITEKAPIRAFSCLKAATTAFTFKTLLRHYL